MLRFHVKLHGGRVFYLIHDCSTICILWQGRRTQEKTEVIGNAIFESTTLINCWSSKIPCLGPEISSTQPSLVVKDLFFEKWPTVTCESKKLKGLEKKWNKGELRWVFEISIIVLFMFILISLPPSLAKWNINLTKNILYILCFDRFRIYRLWV